MNPSTNKTLSPKTVEAYISSIQCHIVPDFALKFQKKKRKTKAKIPYLPEKRQSVWLDYFEQDGRGFALLFVALL